MVWHHPLELEDELKLTNEFECEDTLGHGPLDVILVCCCVVVACQQVPLHGTGDSRQTPHSGTNHFTLTYCGYCATWNITKGHFYTLLFSEKTIKNESRQRTYSGILWNISNGQFYTLEYRMQLASLQLINKWTRVGGQKHFTIWKIKLLRTFVTVLPMSLSIRNWTRMHTTE